LSSTPTKLFGGMWSSKLTVSIMNSNLSIVAESR
jgi:hypothetical protein